MSQQELLRIKHEKELHLLKIKHLEETEKSLKTNSQVSSDETTDDDEEEETPKKSSVVKKTKIQEKLKAADDDEDDLDEALGTGDDDDTREEAVEAGATEIGEDDIRKLLTKITSAKGTAGKNKALTVLKKYSKKESGLVKDLIKGKYEQIYKELKKI